MKKIKLLFAAMLALLLCLPFAGCATEGSVVNNSLEYNCFYSPYDNGIEASYSFKVTLPEVKNYEVSYNVAVYENTRRISSKQETKMVVYNGSEAATVSSYWSIPYTGTPIDDNALRLEVTNVRVTPKKSKNPYLGYSIGFGVAGGALFAVATALFLTEKLKKTKEKTE